MCSTNWTDKLINWKEAEVELERKGLWLPEGKIGPIPYQPENKEYGQDIEIVILLYRVLSTKETYSSIFLSRRKVTRHLMLLDVS